MHTNSNSYGDLQNDHIRIKQNLSLGGLFLQNRSFHLLQRFARFIRLTLHFFKK